MIQISEPLQIDVHVIALGDSTLWVAVMTFDGMEYTGQGETLIEAVSEVATAFTDDLASKRIPKIA